VYLLPHILNFLAVELIKITNHKAKIYIPYLTNKQGIKVPVVGRLKEYSISIWENKENL
jgi:hypothetical protein